jgi:hypothetical protein
MSNFQSSLFDKLILEFSNSENHHPDLNKTEFAAILSFIRDFRVSYLLMANTVIDRFECFHGKSDVNQDEMTITFSDDLIESRLKFYLFINQLNQFSRFVINKLQSKFPPPPLANRIYFFRNKVVEHWDDYVSGPPNDGMRTYKEKIPVPTLSWGFSPPEMKEQRLHEVIKAFEEQGKKIEIDENAFFEELGKIVYPKLEEIDPELKSRAKLSKISESLWHYNFPFPFYDVEEYIGKLKEYLITFKKQ